MISSHGEMSSKISHSRDIRDLARRLANRRKLPVAVAPDSNLALPLLAMGDGAGLVAVVDYADEETTTEFEVGGRVNVLTFSPTGELLLIGTDDCCFTLHETKVRMKLIEDL